MENTKTNTNNDGKKDTLGAKVKLESDKKAVDKKESMPKKTI